MARILKPNNQCFTPYIEHGLYAIYKKMQREHGCIYLVLYYENLETNQRLVFQTDPDWNRLYIGENLIAHCPLLRVGKQLLDANKQRASVLPWDCVGHSNRKQKEVNDARKDHGIFHGINIGREFSGVRETLGMAAEECNKHFTRRLVDKDFALGKILAEARELTLHYAISQGLFISEDAPTGFKKEAGLLLPESESKE